MSYLTNYQYPISTIERDLKTLNENKLTEYVGSAKNGYWKVNE